MDAAPAARIARARRDVPRAIVLAMAAVYVVLAMVVSVMTHLPVPREYVGEAAQTLAIDLAVIGAAVAFCAFLSLRFSAYEKDGRRWAAVVAMVLWLLFLSPLTLLMVMPVV